MQISRQSSYWMIGIVVLIAAGLLIIFLIWRQGTNQPVVIEREQAIQNAIQACNPAYGLQPLEPPTESKAELTTWGRVQGPYNSDPERPVWVVKMKGRWLLVGGPPPASDPSNPTAEQDYVYECTIIIDARTGESLSGAIE